MITRKELVNTLLGSVPCSCCDRIPPREELVIWDTDHSYLVKHYTEQRMRKWVKYSGKRIQELATGGWDNWDSSYLLCEKCSRAVPHKLYFSYLIERP